MTRSLVKRGDTRKRVGVCLMVALAGLTGVRAADAQERRENRGREREEEHREIERRHDEGLWRFERGLGWRFEHRPGVWSPYYVWWWADSRVALLPAPTVCVVQYSHGRYELQGDGIFVPYHWVWVATLPPVPPPPPPVAAPPPPPAPPPAGSAPPAPPPPPPG